MEILRKIFFKHLDQKIRKKIISMARPKKYGRDETVFQKDEVGNKLFILQKGRIKIFSPLAYNKRKTFVFLEPGDIFGELALLGGKKRNASAVAAELSEVLVISKQNFRRFLLKNPVFSLRLLQVLAERLHRADKEIETMLFYNIVGRLAAKILELSAGKNKEPVEIKIDQKEMAEYLGTTRVPMCRAITSLKKSGIINYKKKTITILDMEKLRSMAKHK